jgi:hypothetical protein
MPPAASAIGQTHDMGGPNDDLLGKPIGEAELQLARALEDNSLDLKVDCIDSTSSIRGEFLSAFLSRVGHRHMRASVELSSMTITGPTQLAARRLPYDLRFRTVGFGGILSADAVELRSLRLNNCVMTGVSLEQSVIGGDFLIEDCVLESSSPNLPESCLYPGLDCELRDRSVSCLSMRGASVAGDLRIGRSTLTNPSGNSLAGRGVRIGGAVYLGVDSLFDGTVALPNAIIGGEVILASSRFRSTVGRAVRLGGARIGASLWIVRGGLGTGLPVQITGEFALPGANIDGIVQIEGAEISNAGGKAIDARYLQLRSSFTIKAGTNLIGQFSLVGAAIGSDVDISDSTIRQPTGCALDLGRAVIGGRLRCAAPFSCEGSMRMTGTSVGDVIDMRGGVTISSGEVDRSSSTAEREGGHLGIFAMRLRVGGDVLLEGLKCDGSFVALGRAQIGGRLQLSGCRIGDGRVALKARGLTARGIELQTAERAATETLMNGSVHLASICRRSSNPPRLGCAVQVIHRWLFT